ncbi:MAG: hypothetical protein U9R13_05925 [Campylobacterota bacterium]|nr:hypothetical protein [Campylobacterota bacterium]
MRSDFKPTHLKKANEVLSKHLRKAYANTNKAYKKEVFKRPTLWEKFRALIKR